SERAGLPADGQVYFLVIPCDHQTCFIFFFPFKTDRKYINDIRSCDYFHLCAENIFFCIISKCTPGISFLIEYHGPFLCRGDGVECIPSFTYFLTSYFHL